MPVQWRASVPAAGLQTIIAGSKDAIFVTTGDGVLILDRRTGREVGKFRPEPNGPLSAPVVAGDHALVLDKQFLYAVDNRGKEQWRYRFGEAPSDVEFTAVHPPMVAADGTILAIGSDHHLHAVRPDGHGIGRARLEPYGRGQPAIPLAVTPSTLLIDSRSAPEAPPGLVGIGLGADFGITRFATQFGIDVSGLLLDGSHGIVATSYVETSSRRGSTRIVFLDDRGRERSRVDRGRHEDLRGIGPRGQIIVASRSATAEDPSTVLESWSSARLESSTDLPETPVAVLVDGSSTLVVGCSNHRTILSRYGHRLRAEGTASTNLECAVSATISGRQLLMIVPAGAPGQRSVELVSVAARGRS